MKTLTMIMFSAVIAACFLFWGASGKKVNVEQHTGAFIVMAVTALTILFLGLKNFNLANLPGFKQSVVLVFAGFINGWAVLKYYHYCQASDIPTSMIMSMVSIFMVIESPFYDYFFNGEKVLIQNVMGSVMAIPTIYLLSYRLSS